MRYRSSIPTEGWCYVFSFAARGLGVIREYERRAQYLRELNDCGQRMNELDRRRARLMGKLRNRKVKA